jgi:UDP-N-acetylglucosamine acyltransferase
MDRDEINALKTAYRELFEQGKPLQDVADNFLNTTNSDKVRLLCEFIKTSKRGIPFTRLKK